MGRRLRASPPVFLLGAPTPQRLRPRLDRCAGAPLTYAEVGASAAVRMPAAYAHVEDVVALPGDAFAVVVDALMTWSLHRAAGMSLVATSETVAVDTEVVNAAGFGPIAVAAPCRVVALVDEGDRRGFAYGSLRGHPLRGEEQFTVERDGDRAQLRIRSFSRPVGLGALCPPAARLGQRLVNRRYLAAAAAIARR